MCLEVIFDSCCGAAKFWVCFFFLTSGMSLELLSFAWCSLLCSRKLIVLLPSKYVPLWSHCDYRGNNREWWCIWGFFGVVFLVVPPALHS